MGCIYTGFLTTSLHMIQQHGHPYGGGGGVVGGGVVHVGLPWGRKGLKICMNVRNLPCPSFS
eukprot:CAMPEP_0174319688 /NCGR_PEP_ID=MMETSP0810-20121108/9041_1 /TAXON_ID=73025 ORGANISM="Eutreptiella gymnastica-like, Strain CCMP1594" /NCGR_SAMPLE_ID=MMETSP0810 /ASSEMBLY_ACC=CAM_ASM_000659 /LENGTH=61 /DNA_ID=CAMNT_0015430333 /DNA_START=1271 /DNA_END=1452 /DNA_ORIENTATION=-